MSTDSRKTIYLDYAAAAPVDRRVAKLVNSVTLEYFANASSVHTLGLAAKAVLENSRKKIAGILSVKSSEVIFTGSGTESVNLAILGVARANKNYGKHVVTTNIEHLAVLRACRQLENEGFKVTYAPVEKNGIMNPKKVLAAIKPETILVSVQHANNEIGTVQPIREISKILKDFRNSKFKILSLREIPRRGTSLKFQVCGKFPIFHTDACQTAGFLNIQPNHLGVDLLSFNGSKIYGPKGVAVLFKRSAVNIEPLFFGGSQEMGLRAGTENVALAAGLALALEISGKLKNKETKRLTKMRDGFVEKILAEIPDSRLNGDWKQRLPNNVNVSFKNIDGEMLMLALNQKGIAVSTGSACTTSKTGPSHVMEAIKNPRNWGNLRISLGRETTKSDLYQTLLALKSEVKKLRLLA